jgi:Helix-turn-helix of insertion element transposase
MKPNKTQQKPTLKPLTMEMENAIDSLILGRSDKETAEAVGVNRTTIWEWRQNPVFVAELNRRRHFLWAEAHERLRALVAKAIQQLEEAMDHEVMSPAELLKVVGLGATVGAPTGDTDPETIIHQQAEAQVDKEGIARNSLTAMVENLNNAAWRRRLGEVEAEIRQRYAEA